MLDGLEVLPRPTFRVGHWSFHVSSLSYFTPLALGHIASIPPPAHEHCVPAMEAQVAEQRYPKHSADKEIREENRDQDSSDCRQRLKHGYKPPALVVPWARPRPQRPMIHRKTIRKQSASPAINHQGFRPGGESSWEIYCSQ